MILIIALYGVIASTFTIGKILLDYVPAIYLTAVRMTLAGSGLLIFQRIVHGPLKLGKLKDAWIWLLFSMVHILIPYSAEFIALGSVAPSCAALMFNLSPFFSAIFSYYYFGEKMTTKKWLGFFIGFIAIAWFIQPNGLEFACFDYQKKAYGLLLVSVVCASLGWIYFRMLIEKGYSPLVINGTAMLLAGIQGFGLSRLIEGPFSLPWGHMQSFGALLVSIIFLGNIVFYNAYGYLLKKYTATLLSFIGFILPLFTALFDWLILGMHVQWQFFVTIAIVGYAVYLFYQEELRQGYVK